MADKAPSSSSSSSLPAVRQTATRSFAVDTSGADTEVWLVKVPAVIAELVRASDSGASLGSFTLVESASPANSGARKRQRPTLQVRLDPAAVAAASGSDAVHRVPQSYVLALDEPTGTRVMEQDAARGPFNFIGVSSRSGNMVPDAKDPAYTAFAAHRRQAELQGQAQRRGTVLAPDPAASEGGPAAVAAAARIAATLAAAASGTGARARAPVARAASIYALFERGAYWTLRDMADATGRRENELKPEVARACAYLRSGPHKGAYVLKPEFRSVSSAALDDDVGEDEQ